MKKLLLSISFLAATFLSVAQDVIITKSAEEIQSKVLKVGDNEIEYKKWSNLEGPTYIMNVANVFMIKYQNGDKDVFNEKNVAVVTTPAVKSSDVRIDSVKKEKTCRFSIDLGYVTQGLVLTADNRLYSWWGDKKFTNGFMVGISWNTDVKNGLGYEFCALGIESFHEKFSGSGIASDESGYEYQYTYNGDLACSNFYFSPIKFQYRYKFGKHFALSALTGPTFDLAIRHVYDYKISMEGEVYPQTDTYSMLKSGELRHPLYLNWDFKLGFSYRFLMLQAGTSLGINAVQITQEYCARIKRPLFVTLSFVF